MKFLQNLFKNYMTRMSWIVIIIVATTLVLGATYNPVGNNNAIPQPNYNPVTQQYQNYTITSPTFDTIVNNSNYIIINITNNITNNVTTLVVNNITNNVTTTINQSYYITNNLTNNITNIVENNVTTYVNNTNNISNNFYAGWLTVTYNLTNNVTVENNITQYINTTNFVANNFTNNITNNNYVTINTTNEIVVNITTSTNDTIINNVTVNLNVYNITNNFSNYFNYPFSLSPYILTFENSSNISFNETLLEVTINTTIDNHINYYGELFNTTSTTRTLTTRDIWYNLTSFGLGESNGWYSTESGVLVCNYSGLYQVSYSLSSSLNDNREVQYQLTNNNVAIPKSFARIRYSTNEYDAHSIIILQRFNVNDTLKLQVKLIGVDNKVLTQDNRNIIVNRISK